jgi:hypothetical protein
VTQVNHASCVLPALSVLLCHALPALLTLSTTHMHACMQTAYMSVVVIEVDATIRLDILHTQPCVQLTDHLSRFGVYRCFEACCCYK